MGKRLRAIEKDQSGVFKRFLIRARWWLEENIKKQVGKKAWVIIFYARFHNLKKNGKACE